MDKLAKKVRKNIIISKAYAEWLEYIAKKEDVSQGDIIQEAIYNLRKTYTMRDLRNGNDGDNSE
jgi:hypothetical protein